MDQQVGQGQSQEQAGVERPADIAKGEPQVNQQGEADQRGEDLGLPQDELAFYDALAENHSAVEVLGDETLRVIATELVITVRKNTTIDWTVKESVKAKLRVLVRRALRKYGYPPDLGDAAVKTVLQQAELLALDQAA